MSFRDCGECQACCKGHLYGDAYGSIFRPGQPCIYLKQVCSIYQTRPSVCKKYQCAWTQGITSEAHRPDQSGWLVSVEIDKDKQQYLKAMEIVKNPPEAVYDELLNFVKEHQSYIVRIPYHGKG